MNNYGNQFDGPAYVLGAPANGGTVTFATITDGLSNTAMFSEWIRGKNITSSQGLYQIYTASISATGTTYTPLITYLNSCKTTGTISSGQKGMKWFNHSCSQGGGYSHVMTPNLNACEWSNTGVGIPYDGGCKLLPFRRGERGLRRRLGALCQEQRRTAGVVGDRHEVRRRNRQRH